MGGGCHQDLFRTGRESILTPGEFTYRDSLGPLHPHKYAAGHQHISLTPSTPKTQAAGSNTFLANCKTTSMHVADSASTYSEGNPSRQQTFAPGCRLVLLRSDHLRCPPRQFEVIFVCWGRGRGVLVGYWGLRRAVRGCTGLGRSLGDATIILNW